LYETRKEGSSFSEEKEAKRLLSNMTGGCSPSIPMDKSSLVLSFKKEQIFLLNFRQETPSYLSG
jgi:hypothetical protein